MSETPFESVEDFAKRNGLTLEQVKRWVRLGHLPHVKLGKEVLVPSDALARLLPEARRDRNEEAAR